MKKFVALILAAAVLACACVAFGESEAPSASGETTQTGEFSNSFDEYDQKGYTRGSISISGDDTGLVLQVYFTSPDRTDCVLVEADITDEECAEMEALDFFDENYEVNQWNLVTALPADRVTVTSLNDRIPSEEEVSQYVGKNVQDLMDAGYEWYTDAEDEEGNKVMLFCNGEICIMLAVTLAGDPEIEDLSDELIGFQVVETIRFWGFEG